MGVADSIFGFGKELGIDLGTVNTLLYIKEKNMPIHPLTQRALLDLKQKGML